MQTLRIAMMAGVAAVAMAGFSGAGVAQASEVHVLTVRLPAGAVERIQYSGNRPRVSLSTEPAQPLDVLSFGPDPFAPDPVFADLARLSVQMDREAAAMLREADSLSAFAERSDRLMSVDLKSLPPGMERYSVVSTFSSNGTCARSVEYFARGDGKPPRVFTRISGHCRPMPHGAFRLRLPQRPAVPVMGPHLIEARYNPGAGQR